MAIHKDHSKITAILVDALAKAQSLTVDTERDYTVYTDLATGLVIKMPAPMAMKVMGKEEYELSALRARVTKVERAMRNVNDEIVTAAKLKNKIIAESSSIKYKIDSISGIFEDEEQEPKQTDKSLETWQKPTD